MPRRGAADIASTISTPWRWTGEKSPGARCSTRGATTAGWCARHGTERDRRNRRRLADELHPNVLDGLAPVGVGALYSHQAEALEAAWEGPTVITTGTASGKSMCFNLPTLDVLCRDARARAIYLYPTKALAQDQARALASFGLAGVGAPGDLRRGHAARDARPDPQGREHRADQPRHAARRDPAQPRRLGRPVREPGRGRGRRGARLPGRVRLARRQRAAAAAPDRRGLRHRATRDARLGDDRQPGRAGRAPDRPGGLHADRPRRLAGAGAQGRDLEPAADRRGQRRSALGARRGGRDARRSWYAKGRGRSAS